MPSLTYFSTTLSDAQGRYSLDDLPQGYAQVYLDNGTRSVCVDAEVAANMTTDVDLVLAPLTASLEGHVYLEPGRPATEGSVTLLLETETGTESYKGGAIAPDGSYRFESICRGHGLDLRGFGPKNGATCRRIAAYPAGKDHRL